MRILLIEDSVRLADYVSRGLRRAGFAVDVAMDGEHGQYLAESGEHDVIILDIMLPKRDGLAVPTRCAATALTCMCCYLQRRTPLRTVFAG